jgi:preprotein translocase subunit SecB
MPSGCAFRRRLLPAPRLAAPAAGDIFSTIFRTIDMAEEEGAEGADEQQINGEDSMPQAGIISQYVKDMSFENPNAPAVYQWQGNPRIDVQFNIGTAQLNDEIYEVTLQIDVTATAEQTAFKCELVYAGLFGLRNIAEEQLQPFLLAEAPRVLFPFARQIVAQAVQNGGFPPLLLDPIDFGQLYMQQAAQREAESSGGTAGEITGQA